MKTAKILLCLLLNMGYVVCTLAGNPEVKKAILVNAAQYGAAGISTKSVLYRTPEHEIPEPNYCRQYRTREIAGFTLAGLGVAGIAGGAYMTYIGANGVAHAVTDNVVNFPEQRPPVRKNDLVLTGVGAATAFIGLIFVPTGLAMGITGTVRYNKNCPRERTFYVAPTTKGLGIACKF